MRTTYIIVFRHHDSNSVEILMRQTIFLKAPISYHSQRENNFMIRFHVHLYLSNFRRNFCPHQLDQKYRKVLCVWTVLPWHSLIVSLASLFSFILLQLFTIFFLFQNSVSMFEKRKYRSIESRWNQCEPKIQEINISVFAYHVCTVHLTKSTIFQSNRVSLP